MSRPQKAETGLSAAIQDALALEPGLTMWRNNSGVFRGYNGRVRAGLGVGSADLVGILGPRGWFVALEVKRPGEKADPHQEKWLAAVRERGGFACVVRGVEDARAAIGRARLGLDQ